MRLPLKVGSVIVWYNVHVHLIMQAIIDPVIVWYNVDVHLIMQAIIDPMLCVVGRGC